MAYRMNKIGKTCARMCVSVETLCSSSRDSLKVEKLLLNNCCNAQCSFVKNILGRETGEKN